MNTNDSENIELDDVFANIDNKRKNGNGPSSKKNSMDEDSQTHAFYENEVLRIEKIFNFVQKKFPVKERYPQTLRLVALVEIERAKLCETITNKCILEDSVFRKNIKKIFERTLNL
jgi:hypothetical protein